MEAVPVDPNSSAGLSRRVSSRASRASCRQRHENLAFCFKLPRQGLMIPFHMAESTVHMYIWILSTCIHSESKDKSDSMAIQQFDPRDVYVRIIVQHQAFAKEHPFLPVLVYQGKRHEQQIMYAKECLYIQEPPLCCRT